VHETHHIANAKTLHDFTAVTLDSFDAQLQLRRDLARAPTFGDHPQHFDLSWCQLHQRAAHRQRVFYRGGEAPEVFCQHQILGACANARDRFRTSHGLGDDYERSGWPRIPKQSESCGDIEFAARVMRQYDMGSELAERVDECVLTVRALEDHRKFRPTELSFDQVRVCVIVLKQQYANGAPRGIVKALHYSTISWLNNPPETIGGSEILAGGTSCFVL
jgi:hypothetical protein